MKTKQLPPSLAFLLQGKTPQLPLDVTAEGLLDAAWGLIANASGGDWSKQEGKWVRAAKRFAEAHRALPKPAHLLSELYQVESAPAGTKSWEQCSPATPHEFEAREMELGAITTARLRGQAKQFRIVKTVRTTKP